eukprot:CAMPEP_0203665366 /NCGR_PEP_ID=MMETSP0090-20130426/2585_1 /ASSEMBLY_ACC=CAM_ASM_001088 /TAXON_ID=426623 /ORGANISM="Chaetoceros affinis, Strain CCMP159" /LENGTH=794 /DNA_ID=CAMNT_0050528883 /DNA_START=316 /DNA_END=2697 /DNA_ORIENTATION=-
MARATTTTRGVVNENEDSSEYGYDATFSSSLSSYSSTITEYDYWVGEDPVDGSIFNYVQDGNGNISGSMVDLTNHNVLQFHNRNGLYMVTITASSDFAPEDVDDDDGGRRLMEMENKNEKDDESKMRKLLSETSIPRPISIAPPPRKSLSFSSSSSSSSSSSLAKDSMIPSFLHVNTQTNRKDQGSSASRSRKLYDDNGGNIDTMVVWTAAAECNAYGLSTGCTLTSQSEANMLVLINLAIQETNDAYQASGIQTELLLVHAYRHPTYVESSFGSTLSDMQSGSLSGVQSNRATYGADIVAMLIDDSQYCGLAYVGPRIDLMYSVTAWNCATGYYTFGHEVGHNLGCLHDRGTEDECSSGGYNYGYRDPSANFRTVLAYNCVSGQCDNNAGGGCSRIPRFSNPNFTYNNAALGTSSIDNARAINDVRVEVAGYYTHVNPQTPAPTPSAPGPTPTAPTPTPPTFGSCGNSVCEVSEGEGCGTCSSDCSSPTNCNSLSNGAAYYGPTSYGIVFDVVAATNLYFYELDVILLTSSAAKVYMKSGSFTSDSNLNNWQLVFEGSLQPNSSDERDSIQFNSRFYTPSGSTASIYISYGSPGAFVFEGPGDVSNADVTLKSGNVLTEQFGNTLPSVIYYGYSFSETIKYDYAVLETPAPTKAVVGTPTSAPVAPTVAPIAIVPTSAPVAPTAAPVAPTSAPVAPTAAPVAPTSAPVAPTSAPVAPTAAPVAPTTAPVAPTSAPVATPTSSPVTSPVSTPTSAPVSSTPAPVSAPSETCNDSPFRIKVKKNDGTIRTRSCVW